MLSAPSTLSACDDLTLSGISSSGGGIFALGYYWNCSATTSTGAAPTAALLQLLGSADPSLSRVTIPADAIYSGQQLRFSLVVYSELGGRSAAVEVVREAKLLRSSFF